jgi:DNA-binding response OmpR family regulator
LDAGANAYLTKPISQDELLEAVHQNLLPQSPESSSDPD